MALCIHNAEKDELEVCTENQVIPTSSGTITVPSNTRIIATPHGDGRIWQNNPNAGGGVSAKLYYQKSSIHDECRCRFTIDLSPVQKDPDNIGYHHTWCSEKLTIRQVAPLSVTGLEKPPFSHFTSLTIHDCTKLSGTSGALKNILAVMKNLEYLNLTNSQLDETIIDAEHAKLTQLILKGCNCTEIKRIVMPQLWLLLLDYNPLPFIDRSVIKVLDGCAIGTRKKIT